MRRRILGIAALCLGWIQWAEGRVDGLTLATGVWDVTLSTHQSDLLFPTTSPQTLKRHRPRWFPQKQQRLDCTMLLFANGTFSIYPPCAPTEQRLTTQNRDHADKCQYEAHKSSVLHMNGRWQWNQSPYCATDQFHDTVQLESYPRSAIQQLDSDNITSFSGSVLQRGSFILHSRLYGHYARRRSRNKPQPHARMVRGVCLWSPLAMDTDQKQQQRSAGSQRDIQPQQSSHDDSMLGPQTMINQGCQRISAAWKGWTRHQKPLVATFVARKRSFKTSTDG